MAHTIGKLLLLQIVCSLAIAQFEDVEDYSSGSGGFSGDVSDPTLVDYEQDYDYDYEIAYVPEEVDICDSYPIGITIKLIYIGDIISCVCAESIWPDCQFNYYHRK